MNQPSAQITGVSLRRLLPEAEFHGVADLVVTSCSGDSRACQPGDLFVALLGGKQDGHNHAREAIRRGATAVLAERILPRHGRPLCIVPDTRAAFGRICQALAGEPSHKLSVIGVTGTNGKTTTTCLIASVLQAAGARVGTLGTLGYDDSEQLAAAPHTTPPAPVLATWLSRMVANGCTHAVMEASSHALCQSRMAGIRLDAACVTNVRRDHLDYHGSLANYRAAKAQIFDHLAPEGFSVLNADDPVCGDYLATLGGPVLTVGIDAPAEISATLVERYHSEQTFLLTAGSETIPVRTRMIGRHHIANCLMATAVGLAYGLDLSVVVRGLEAVTHVSGRLERLECGQPFGVFVDYAHTPDALTNSLQTLREVTEGRLICVFGAGGNRDRGKRPLMGRAVERLADIVVVTSDNPRHEDPLAIIGQIARGFERGTEAQVIPQRETAIQWALSEARAGDCVLIAGKGHENYQIIGDRQYECDDRDTARQWLYEHVASHPALHWSESPIPSLQ